MDSGARITEGNHLPPSVRRFQHAPHTLFRFAGKLASHHRLTFVAAIVLERELPVAVGDANQRQTALPLNIYRTSLYLGTLFADFHRGLRVTRNRGGRDKAAGAYRRKEARWRGPRLMHSQRRQGEQVQYPTSASAHARRKKINGMVRTRVCPDLGLWRHANYAEQTRYEISTRVRTLFAANRQLVQNMCSQHLFKSR